MDSKLPTFLTNPDKVGGDSPTFLKYPEGANLFAGNAEGAMVDTKRVTRAPGILTLSGVSVIKAGEAVTHYQIRPEGGWLPAANIIKLPQWALGDLGFVTLDRKPESFDLIDGKKQPNNVVKGILAEMYKAAKADPRTGSALYHYNYERLLKQIDRNNDGQFSEEEYIQAIRLPAYRDHLYRIIAKHPSEWWYGKDDALWKKYLDTLKEDAPAWKTYLEAFIDRLTWMKSVAGIGPDPWHMHPVVFLEALVPNDDDEMDLKWLEVPKGQLTFDVEGNDIETSVYFSRRPHVPNNKGVVIGKSGVTFGRGLDLGQQSKVYVEDLFAKMEGNTKPFSSSLKEWLLGSVGKKGNDALLYCNEIDNHVPKSEQLLTRKQQHYLFNSVYFHQYETTKRVLTKGVKIDEVNVTANIDNFEQDIQDVLVDLTFRGDNSALTRKYFISDLNDGRVSFKSNISNVHWKDVFHVPPQRFDSRKGYL
jgi:hypothetical protein